MNKRVKHGFIFLIGFIITSHFTSAYSKFLPTESVYHYDDSVLVFQIPYNTDTDEIIGTNYLNKVGYCAENGSCYGDISKATGKRKTTKVRGYYRKDGTYVRGHYRSR